MDTNGSSQHRPGRWSHPNAQPKSGTKANCLVLIGRIGQNVRISGVTHIVVAAIEQGDPTAADEFLPRHTELRSRHRPVARIFLSQAKSPFGHHNCYVE